MKSLSEYAGIVGLGLSLTGLVSGSAQMILDKRDLSDSSNYIVNSSYNSHSNRNLGKVGALLLFTGMPLILGSMYLSARQDPYYGQDLQ